MPGTADTADTVDGTVDGVGAGVGAVALFGGHMPIPIILTVIDAR